MDLKKQNKKQRESGGNDNFFPEHWRAESPPAEWMDQYWNHVRKCYIDWKDLEELGPSSECTVAGSSEVVGNT